jgi:NADH-quinone oxidoreductase subunit L
MENSPIWLSLVVLLPLLGSVISYLVGRVVPRLSGVVASFAVGVAFVATLVLSQGLQKSGPVSSTLSSWLSFGSHSIPLDLYFDSLSSVMCLIITGVGFLIHLYSIGYMAEDESKARFFAYLNLFVASMLVLVLGKSLPVIFIGWEGVGLCSYLLIGFWFTNPEYASAGRKAFVMNRIGDVGFLIAMAGCIPCVEHSM